MAGPLNLPSDLQDMDEATHAIVVEALGYAEAALDGAELPFPVYALEPPRSGLALSIEEGTQLMEWAKQRIARAYLVGYGAAIDAAAEEKARRLAARGRKAVRK